MRATLMTAVKTALIATGLATALTATALAGDRSIGVHKHDIGYWSRVDLDTVIFYDWSMRTSYRVELRDACDAMNGRHGARLSAMFNGRLTGAKYDKMLFNHTPCYIDSVQKLSKDQYAALTADGVQVAAFVD